MLSPAVATSWLSAGFNPETRSRSDRKSSDARATAGGSEVSVNTGAARFSATRTKSPADGVSLTRSESAARPEEAQSNQPKIARSAWTNFIGGEIGRGERPTAGQTGGIGN